MLRRVALVRTDVSEELSASFIRVTRVGELDATLTATNKQISVLLDGHTCKDAELDPGVAFQTTKPVSLRFFVVSVEAAEI
jgi:hypothetical protein